MASPELQQGTLDLLILKTLAQGPLHGWGISRHIRETSRGGAPGTTRLALSGALRLEDKGMIVAEWGISPEGRRARFYRLSPTGRRQLAREAEAWRVYTGAVNLVLKAT